MATVGVKWNKAIIAPAIIAVPGSPYLLLNGLPFVSRTEVAAIVLVTLAFGVTAIRNRVFARFSFSNKNVEGLVYTALVVVLVAKVFSFALQPLGSGFEACYRSTYSPTANNACEKSYELPYYRNDEVNAIGDITRIDKEINFGSRTETADSLLGAGYSNWNLPFANDYPRLSTPWLSRLPFTVQHGGFVEIERNGVIPIEYVGKISLAFGNHTYEGESYNQRKTALIPVLPGRTPFSLKYTFSDDNTDEIPDSPPTASGPYAHLYVGAVTQQKETPLNVAVQVRGWVADTTDSKKIIAVRANTSGLSETAEVGTTDRPDVGAVLNNPQLSQAGFVIEVPINEPLAEHNQIELNAVFADGSQQRFATIRPGVAGSTGIIDLPSFVADTELQLQVDAATYVLGERSETLAAERMAQPGSAVALMMWLIDAIQLLIVGVALFFCLMHVRRPLVHAAPALAAAVGAVAVIRFVGRFVAIDWITIQTIVVVGLVGIFHARRRSGLLVSAVVAGGYLTIGRMLDFLQTSMGVSSGNWWGTQLFRQRDSDWLVYQGYAREIFNSESLRGGENVFYFMPGARYLIFVEHLLFGDNDVFIALLTGTALIALLVYVTVAICSNIEQNKEVFSAIIPAAVVLLFTTFEMVQFAAASAGEVPAWLLLLASTLFINTAATEKARFLWFAAALGLAANFRPNIAVALVWILVLIVIKIFVETPNRMEAISRNIQATFLFGSVFCLSLIHNLWYGATWVFFKPLQADVVEFPASDLVTVFWNDELRSLVVNKSLQVLGWREIGFAQPEATASVLLQLVWLFAVVKLVRTPKTNWFVLLFGLTPLLLLISQLPFLYTSMPSRHFATVNLMFGITAAAMLGRGHKSTNPNSRRDAGEILMESSVTLDA